MISTTTAKQEYTSKYMVITPTMAEHWLGNHINFRNLSKLRVARLAADIGAGKWHINGESIKLTPDNVLFDGQHRLAAVVMSGKPITSLVTWTNHTLGVDRGQVRKFSQLLASLGYNKTALTQGTARLLYLLHYMREIPSKPPQLTDDELLTFFNTLDYPVFEMCMRWGDLASRAKISPSTSAYAAAMFLFVGINSDRAEEFHCKLMSGENLTARSPILVLRNRFQYLLAGPQQHTRISSRGVMALLIKAWKAFINDQPVSLLKFLDSETFPEIPFM